MILMRKLPLMLVIFSASILSLHGQARPAEASPAPQSSKASTDCTEDAPRVPKGYSRVYIAQRNGKDGSGRSLNDARDGSTTARFDTILRCLSEGCPAGQSENAVPKTENLIVCLGPGVFQTKGTYDFLIAVPRT